MARTTTNPVYRVNVCLTQRAKEELKLLASEKQISESALVRILISEEFKRNKRRVGYEQQSI